jgi:hypothetical protein
MPVNARAPLGSYAAQVLRTRDPWPSNYGAQSAQALRRILRHRKSYHRRSFEQMAARKTLLPRQKGTPRDIAMKLNAALDPPQKHAA